MQLKSISVILSVLAFMFLGNQGVEAQSEGLPKGFAAGEMAL